MDTNFRQNLPHESAEDLYENAPCGYISFLGDGTIFRINNTLLHLLGYEDKEELLRVKKVQDLFRIGGKIYFETHFFPLVKMQGYVKEINFDLVKKDASFFPALINVNQISATGSGPVTYRTSVLDITDRKKYEKVLLEGKERAEEATRVKAEFLSTISHEIRTPLHAIVGIGNLIQDTSLDKLQKEYARILQFSSANLLELVNNLLDLSKLDAHKVKLEKKGFNLNELLEGIIHTFKLRANEKKIDLKGDFPEHLPNYLLGDPIKLKQILTNLLGNAIKFTRQGSVTLKIEEVNKDKDAVSLNFTISDTGIGIPKDKLKIIFQEFSQASYDVNLEFGGTGLGLTISQKLLQMHGSELKVSSEEEKGTDFSFILNFKRLKDPHQPQKSSGLKENLAATGARVLVVDDNPVNLFITSQYLESWGLTYKTVESGIAAKKAILEKDFDIILMDLHMPKMNGYEASKAIRELRPTPPPVIIALSASGRGDINLKMKRAGINAYVPKPFNPSELQEVMLQFLNGKSGDVIHSEKKPNPEYIQPPKDQNISTPGSLPVGLEKFLELAKGNKEIYDKLIENSRQSIINLQKEFSETVFDLKGEKLSQLMHKNTMTLHYLQAQHLSQLMEDFREALRKEKKGQELEKSKNLVIKELTHILGILEKAV